MHYNLKTARHRASRSGLFFLRFVLHMRKNATCTFHLPVKILASPLESATPMFLRRVLICRPDVVCGIFIVQIKYLPHFYFMSIQTNDMSMLPSAPGWLLPAKFEVCQPTRLWLKTFFNADTLRRAVTLNICSVSAVTWSNSTKFERNRTIRGRIIAISTGPIWAPSTWVWP